MKNKTFRLLFILLSIILTISSSYVSGCTIFTISNDESTFFGNNEDWINPNTYMMIRPALSANEYGGIFFGFDNFVFQGGINSEGLSYDGNALSPRALNFHPEKLIPLEWVPNIAMKYCSNISQVISLIKKYDWRSMHREMKYQVHFADSNGDAIVVSPGLDGEIKITKKTSNESFLVSTNFNLDDEDSRYCWRYQTASTMLEAISDKELDINKIKDILAAVHQEGPTVNTVYSNIMDLKNKMIYLCHFYQFGEIVSINVTEELNSGITQNKLLKDLFSNETIINAEKHYLLYLNKNFLAELFNFIVILTDITSLFVLALNLMTII